MNKKVRKYVTLLIIIISLGIPGKAKASYEPNFPIPDLTGDYVTDLLEIAKSQLGYTESDSHETIYSDWANQSGKAWCSEFIAWCANQAGIPEDIVPKAISWNRFRRFYSAQGRYYILDNGRDNDTCGCAEMAAGVITINDVEPGDILLLESSGNYADGPDHSCICMYVSGQTVVTIDGNIKGRVGTAVRKVDRIHGVCKPSYDLRVTGISLQKSSFQLKVGGTRQINASVVPRNALVRDLLYSSSDSDVANVDSNGKVTAIAAGTAEITVSSKEDSSIKTVCQVTVKPPSTATPSPTAVPGPTTAPTEAPDPTTVPTEIPSPTEAPNPTAVPTKEPSPTAVPTKEPSPTTVPTEAPSPTAAPAPTTTPAQIPDANDLRKAADDSWYYYINGQIAWEYTGLVYDETVGWWLVRNGSVDFGYTGLWNDSTYGWWLVSAGTVAFDYNGLWNDPYCDWWLINGGTVAFDYTGLWNDPACGWWLISNGTIAFDYTGLWNDPYCGWWLINGGTVAFDYTGLWNDPYCGWWLISNGTIAFDYTGLWNDPYCGWWLINGGTVAFDYTALWNDPACGWWLIGSGTIAFDYTGFWNDPIYGGWYVDKGMLDFSHVGAAGDLDKTIVN